MRKKKKRKKILLPFLLIVGIIILLNILAESVNVRLDLTEDGRYTLNNATKEIIQSLDEPITITAFFSEDLPPHIAKIRRFFKDMLVEYANHSEGMILYEFIDPNKDDASKLKAMQAGIQPVLINVREKDQQKQQRAYLGAKVQMGDDFEVIPLIQPEAPVEYELTKAIKKIAAKDKPSIGFIVGHGEPTLKAYSQAYEALSVLYNPEAYRIADSLRNITDFKTLILMAPKDSIAQEHLDKLDEYLASGGNLVIGLNRVDGNLQSRSGNTINTGLESWLREKGIVVNNNFIVDANCAAITVRQQQGAMVFNSQLQFPYLPIITNFAEHPITKELEAVVMPFVSKLDYIGDSALQYTPLLFSSEKSNVESLPVQFNIEKQWTPEDFPESKLPIGGILSGKIVGKNESKIVVFADGDFPVNGEGESSQRLQDDNINLLVNSIDWLSDNTGLIELRTEKVTARMLNQVEEGKKRFLKLLNFLLPLIVVIVIGLIRLQMNKTRRIKRMEEGYVK